MKTIPSNFRHEVRFQSPTKYYRTIDLLPSHCRDRPLVLQKCSRVGFRHLRSSSSPNAASNWIWDYGRYEVIIHCDVGDSNNGRPAEQRPPYLLAPLRLIKSPDHRLSHPQKTQASWISTTNQFPRSRHALQTHTYVLPPPQKNASSMDPSPISSRLS